MLNLNEPQSKSEEAVPTWKILIYDRIGQDIISPLISIKELRDLGITLHMQLHSDRDSIPEVTILIILCNLQSTKTLFFLFRYQQFISALRLTRISTELVRICKTAYTIFIT